MRIPTSTYRLQVRPGFDFDAVAGVIPYLADLGVDWIYLSPILQAERGSEHGYDVTDPTRLDVERGGEAGFRRAVAAARHHGLGVLVDIVPNHLGVATPAQNPWWWDVLKHGQSSPHAAAFDIDWAAGDGRLRIPVLGTAADVAALTVIGDELHYYDHRFPLAPGTADDGADAVQVHARQHYELVDWRRADDELNYRRFFAVNSLAGLRVELPRVFDMSHAQVARWFDEGLVDGLRVDHPDGLHDPKGYLDRLRVLTGGAWVLVEKILEPGEALPANWAVSGSTGYDALALIDRVLTDPKAETPLIALDARLRGEAVPWPELVHHGKREVTDGMLRSEVRRLVRDLGWDRFDAGTTEQALAEVLACFPVYRSYLPDGAEHLAAAVREATRRRPELAEPLRALSEVLEDPRHPAATRFQQTSGMVMAKGVEDRAFYQYSPLTSLTEVGADPSEFSVSVDRFHAVQQQRQAHWPHTMTTLSTHDTKRSEDARSRLAVLAELPDDWAEELDALRSQVSVGDGPLENLLWQATIAAWPIGRDRLLGYALKAAREADLSTHWTVPDEAFERKLTNLVDATVADPVVIAVITAFVDRISAAGFSNGLTAKLLQLTAPGVPDVYQGSELWELSLVDPDNRRPVDFAERARLLARLDDGWRPPVDSDGAAKLLVTSRALRLRRDNAHLFTGYRPLLATGAAADHLIGFDRGGAISIGTRLPLGLADAGGWRDTAIQLESAHTDQFTRRRYEPGEVPLATLLEHYPVALLSVEEAPR
ncbi:malto-oligosyltrehalose synthase [Salinibacterium sp. ZJ454]|uniref:malto-oligosyltrehalose synthase n=1 Tax=Salinibacterium sp. ZJ454 TaxID=2708339 RepID=UPI0014220455|nr:malto-oligosyltrehalose synthase [Salinibacterium sp. ZJ454]